MTLFTYWKIGIISGSGLVGAACGLVTTFHLDGAALTAWAVAVPVVSTAALGVSAGCAMCHLIEICLRKDEIRNPSADRTLCYRGVRH